MPSDTPFEDMPQDRAMQARAPTYIIEATEEYGAGKMRLLRDTICKGLTLEEMGLYLQVARSKKLDPFDRQIYAIKRWDSKLQREVMTIQIGIDGTRALAERTGRYGGQIGPQWCGEDGVWRDVWLSKEKPRAARVGIVRTDWREPLWQVALWDEFAQTNKENKLTGLWRTHPTVMLAKCSESAGFRRAFPNELSGIYGAEEVGVEEHVAAAQATLDAALERQAHEAKEKAPAEARRRVRGLPERAERTETVPAASDAPVSVMQAAEKILASPLEGEQPPEEPTTAKLALVPEPPPEAPPAKPKITKAERASATKTVFGYCEALDACKNGAHVADVEKAWGERIENLQTGQKGARIWLRHTLARLALADDSGKPPELSADEQGIIGEMSRLRREAAAASAEATA